MAKPKSTPKNDLKVIPNAKPARELAPLPGHISFSEFKGFNLVVFSATPQTGENFSFAAGKAQHLLAAMAECGTEEVIAALMQVAGNRLSKAQLAKLGYRMP